MHNQVWIGKDKWDFSNFHALFALQEKWPTDPLQDKDQISFKEMKPLSLLF